MKKLLTLVIGIVISTFLGAQTFVNEDFGSGTMPPEGWTQLPLTTGWYSSNTSHAGGIAPEAKFEGFSYTGTARLISPSMNMNSTETAALVFKHNYIKAGSGVTIGVATRSGGDWTTVWETTPNADIEAGVESIVLSGDELTGSYFQFCFYLTGTLNGCNAWYIDDVEFFAPLEFDAKMSSILVPDVISNPAPVSCQVLNLGTTTINEVNVSWVSYGGIERDSTFSGLNLGFAEQATLDFNGTWASPLGEHDLSMWINTTNGGNDLNQDNDTLVKTIEYQSVSYPYMPLFEEFTSSTCAPCASFNSSFVPWCNTHENDIILLKYQMNWPGAGDPYYTAEGGTRRSYYGVNAVPMLFAMGEHINTSIGSCDAALSQAQQKTSTFDIASSFTMTGSTINITTNILSFATVSNLKVYNVVVEKITTENASTNGETEFEHVMMKMFPNGNGVSKSFTSGVPEQFTYTYDMSTTNVEEMDDLLMVVFIQNQSTHEVFQAAYGFDGIDYSDEARLSDIYIDGTPLEGFDPDVYEYNVEVPEGTIEEPALTAIPMNENAQLITNMAFAVPGTATIDVYAEDLYHQKTYTINYYIDYVGTNEIDKAALVKVYPNPANDQLMIKGLQNANLKVVSLNGQVVLEQNNFNGGTLDISNLSKGVYFVNLVLDNNQKVYKKIIKL